MCNIRCSQFSCLQQLFSDFLFTINHFLIFGTNICWLLKFWRHILRHLHIKISLIKNSLKFSILWLTWGIHVWHKICAFLSDPLRNKILKINSIHGYVAGVFIVGAQVLRVSKRYKPYDTSFTASDFPTAPSTLP